MHPIAPANADSIVPMVTTSPTHGEMKVPPSAPNSELVLWKLPRSFVEVPNPITSIAAVKT